MQGNYCVRALQVMIFNLFIFSELKYFSVLFILFHLDGSHLAERALPLSISADNKLMRQYA